jgi:hypothetical protein
MNVIYLPAATQWGEGRVLIEQATRRLEEIMRPEAALATVTWDRVEDSQKRSFYQLKVKYFTWEATALFTPEQLQDHAHMHVRLYRLWGDLLQMRNDAVHRQAVALSGQISE